MNFLLGIISGVLGSYILWIVLSKYIVPKIIFSERISKIKDEVTNKEKCKIRFHNKGIRDIIDLEVVVIFRVKNLKNYNSNTWDILHISIVHNNIPELNKRKFKTFSLLLNESKDFGKDYIPSEIREKFNNNSLKIEDLFTMGVDRNLQIFVFGYDNFSGSRKLFKSKCYSKKDIFNGKFKFESLEIEETSDLKK